MEDIKPPFIMSVTGPKRVGKTTFIRNLINDYLLDKFDYIIVICPTAELNGDYDFLYDQCKTKFLIRTNGFEESVGKVFNRQEQLKKAGNAPDTLIVVDDCGTDRILSARSILDKYAIRHRHAHVSYLCVGHNHKGDCGLPKTLRTQIDYNVMYSPASMVELENMLKDSLFSEDVKPAMKAVRQVFSEKYNYIVYQPAEMYGRRLLVNFKTPLLETVSLTNDKKRRLPDVETFPNEVKKGRCE